ncbi:MAG: transcriptional repressor [Pseudomonadota bacterium]
MFDRIEVENQFREYLKHKGLTLTLQRKLILDEIYKNHEHFEAEEIIQAFLTSRKKVSRATIYRTLVHLDECELIRKIDIGDGRARYEHIYGHEHHEHLCCMECSQLIEFTDKKLEKRIIKVAKKSKFHITSHTVQISGYCNACFEVRESKK